MQTMSLVDKLYNTQNAPSLCLCTDIREAGGPPPVLVTRQYVNAKLDVSSHCGGVKLMLASLLDMALAIFKQLETSDIPEY